ncbi:MAG: hypothetical protein Q7S52_04005 [bacterium]|nr:hypothetical protein [bacterium]
MESILDYLDQLRAKPAHVRKRIALVTTAALSLVIGSVWWHSWNVEEMPITKNEAVAASIDSPWNVVRDTLREAKETTLTAFTDAVGELRENNLQYAAPGGVGDMESPSAMVSDAAGADQENNTENPAGNKAVVVSENFYEEAANNDFDRNVAAETATHESVGATSHTRPKTIE